MGCQCSWGRGGLNEIIDWTIPLLAPKMSVQVLLHSLVRLRCCIRRGSSTKATNVAIEQSRQSTTLRWKKGGCKMSKALPPRLRLEKLHDMSVGRVKKCLHVPTLGTNRSGDAIRRPMSLACKVTTLVRWRKKLTERNPTNGPERRPPVFAQPADWRRTIGGAGSAAAHRRHLGSHRRPGTSDSATMLLEPDNQLAYSKQNLGSPKMFVGRGLASGPEHDGSRRCQSRRSRPANIEPVAPL